MKNILVTGAAGFIGSNFVRYALQADPSIRIVSLDALTYAGSLENLRDLPAPERHTFQQGDICDRALVTEILGRHRIDTVVHFAAETHVDRSIHNARAFVETNVGGTLTLLEAAREHWLDGNPNPGRPVRFHHISTDEVFGSLEAGDPAWTEGSPYAPNSPYAASKAASDHLVRAFGHTYRLPYTLTNCSNNYGPRQFPEKLIPLIILNALQGKPLPVYGDGQQIRDWLYVRDHCSAIRRVLEAGRVGEVYNIGGWNEKPNIEVVQTLCRILDELQPRPDGQPYAAQITYVKDRPGHDRRYAIDARKLERELGWKPAETFETGIRKTVRWYLDNQDWVANVTSGAYRDWVGKHYGSPA
jgi:dTDP-glucose 4,6-dehydratase